MPPEINPDRPRVETIDAPHRGRGVTEDRVLLGGPKVKTCIHRRKLQTLPNQKVDGPLCPACEWEAPRLRSSTR